MKELNRRALLEAAGLTGAASFAGAMAASPASAASARAATRVPDREFHVFMVLGRGESDNEYGFKDYLARRGLKVRYTVRNAASNPEKLEEIKDEIRAAKPDLIYSWGTPQTRGLVGPHDAEDASPYIRDIPVVFTFVAAPLDAKIVSSLEHPGRNVTGTVHIAPVAVQVNTILAYRPITKLGVVYNPLERNSVLAVSDLAAEWGARGLTLIEAPVPSVDEKPDASAVPGLVAHCRERGAEMLYIGPDTFIAFHNRKVVADKALELGLPTFSVTELIVRTEKAMLALASSSYGIGRFTGFKAEQVLVGGVGPGDIPVETLRRFSVIINMPVAKQLSFYPPISLLNFAEVVGV